MPTLFVRPLAGWQHGQEGGRIERSSRGVADLEVEVWTGRDAVASGDASARADGLTAPDPGAWSEPSARRREMGVERPDAGPSEWRRVLDLDDETVPRPAADGADDARGHGPDGGAEGDREVGAVVVPSPARDRVPPPAERGADRAAGGPDHEG